MPDNFSFIDRYFLRRLAIARRRRDRVSLAAAYSEAKVEVILVVIAMPVFAILSGAAVLSLHWSAPGHVAKLPPKYVTVIAIWAICAVVGNLWLDRRFREHLQDQATAWLSFDTEEDRRIAQWQKAIAIVVCGAVVPLLALLVVFMAS